MSSVLWTRLFWKLRTVESRRTLFSKTTGVQCYLRRMGKLPVVSRTKHINIRYFFVTDRIKKGDLKVEWCPTDEMIADFWTKPNQGSLFRKFRDRIMGVEQPKDSGSRSSRKPKQ